MSRLVSIFSAAVMAMTTMTFSIGVYAQEPAADAAWASIRKDIFGARDFIDGKGFVSLEAPERAEDAAVVPVTIRLTPELAANTKSLTLIVDENPAPVVAVFKYGEAAGIGQRTMATRIRVDRFSFVRAVAETTDGELYMTQEFVKASGGCSAPASRDIEEATKSIGRMRIKTASAARENPNVGEVMIRHPNISGLAIDQITRGYPPARFISKLTVSENGKLVFTMDGGISISEDPYFRFSYIATPGSALEVAAEDSDGVKFEGRSDNPS